eukprot:1562761-Pyramimonas_sp.AAC.1
MDVFFRLKIRSRIRARGMMLCISMLVPLVCFMLSNGAGTCVMFVRSRMRLFTQSRAVVFHTVAAQRVPNVIGHFVFSKPW